MKPKRGIKRRESNKKIGIRLSKLFFTVRPSHTLRYGFKTRNSYLGKIPILREFFVTGVSFTFKVKK